MVLVQIICIPPLLVLNSTDGSADVGDDIVYEENTAILDLF